MTTLLVDANNIACRAFYAAGRNPERAEQLLASWLIDCRRRWGARRRIAAFDGGGSFRRDLFDGYKAKRPPKPDGMRAFVEEARQVAADRGFAVRSSPGYEADDVIATAHRWSGDRCVVVSGDRDLWALVDDRTVVAVPNAGVDGPEVDREAVVRQMGVWPRRVPDLKALAGDSSDNVPGVPQIGPKAAVELIQQYGGVRDILDAPPIDKPTTPGERALVRVQSHAERVLLCLELVTLRTDAPIGDCP